jgi:hypothetical protein
MRGGKRHANDQDDDVILPLFPSMYRMISTPPMYDNGGVMIMTGCFDSIDCGLLLQQQQQRVAGGTGRAILIFSNPPFCFAAPLPHQQ